MLHVAPVAVDDSFTVPADKELQASCASNDLGRVDGIVYLYTIVGSGTARPNGSSQDVPLSPSSAFNLAGTGDLLLNPEVGCGATHHMSTCCN